MTAHSSILERLRVTALVAAVGVVFVTGTAVADEGSYHPMRFDRVSQDEGLSQNSVFAITQDSDGFLWVGTENGLNRYNGYEFDVFKRERGNPEALGSDYIYDVVEGKNGALWIATNGGGLSRLDRTGETFQTFRHDPKDARSLSNNVVRTLLPTAEGSIWIGTLGSGVEHFDPKSGVTNRFSFGADAAFNEVYALHEGTDGVLWVGTNAGLVKLATENGEFEVFEPSSTGLSGPRVRTIVEDVTGSLWVGTYASGLNRFDPETGMFEQFRNDPADSASLSGDRVTTVFEDGANRLWVGTYGGLNLLDRETDSFVRYQHDRQDASSLADDVVTTLFEDRSGMLWVGTRNRGLNKWNPRSWSYGLEDARELAKQSGEQPNVTSFAVDADGILWLGTFGDGLHAVDRTAATTETYRHDPADANSLSDDRVMSLLLDSRGALWVGTMTGGLNRIDIATGENTVFKHDPANANSVAANGIMTLFEDSAGHVWVGTYGGGANRFDAVTESFTRFLPDSSDPKSISSSRVRAFAEDNNGMLWVGTDAGGLNLFDPKTETFTAFRHDPLDPNTLADDTVYSINVSPDGTIWVGTQGGGLDRVVGSADRPAKITFANVSQKDGLANDVIYGVQFDASERLWLSTNYGISRFDPATGDIKNLHRKDGLQSEEFNSGAHFRSSTGELFFGGPDGFNAFQPEDVKTNSVVPLVALTGMFSGNDRVRADTPTDGEPGIDITYKDDTMSFEFAALDYAAPEQNQYRYKLDGFDGDWIELGNRRRVTYTDLEDGQYLLRVQASNSDGVWNEAGFSLPVRVSPAPWDTWWAYLGYLAMVAQLGGFLWLGHKRKIRREEEYSSRLEDEVRERTEKLVESNLRLRELNHALQESSLSDPLTGLRNRRFVFEEVSRDLDVIRRKIDDEEQGVDQKGVSDLVFMMIDLDNFKPINDTYGHAAGDQMLLEVRDVLLGTCRKSDFVIRWGGDEFVVIAKQAKPGESEALAERIRSSIADHNFMLSDGQIVRTTCSIGFAAFPLFRGQAEDADLDQILTLADTLMYEAKRQRNAWAGMLSPTNASTSFDFDQDAIEPSSLLFRAKRAGRLISHGVCERADDLQATG